MEQNEETAEPLRMPTQPASPMNTAEAFGVTAPGEQSAEMLASAEMAQIAASRTANALDREFHDFTTDRSRMTDPDRAFKFLDDWSDRRFGVRGERGMAWNPDAEEFKTPDEYANFLRSIVVKGYSAIEDDVEREWRTARQSGDRAAMIKAAGIKTEKPGYATGGAYDFFDPGMGAPNAMVPKTDDEIDDELKEYGARMAARRFGLLAKTVGHDFDSAEMDMVYAALKTGDGIPEEHRAAYRKLLAEDVEKAARLNQLVQYARLANHGEFEWGRLARDIKNALVKGVSDTYHGLAFATKEEREAARFYREAVAASPNSAMYYWNDAEKAEYKRLVEAGQSRQYELANRLGSTGWAASRPNPSYAPSPAEAKARVDAMCARRLAKEALPLEEQRRQIVEQRMLDEAFGSQPYNDYGYFWSGVIGAVGTLPYMGMAMVPVVGTPAVAVSYFGQMKEDIIANGGDPDEAVAAQWIMAAGYALVERLEAATAFGKPLTGLQRKAMLLHIAKATGKNRLKAIGAFAAQNAWEAAATTIGEVLEEGVQGFIEGGERQWFMPTEKGGHDFGKALTAAVRQGINDFKESIPTMGVIAATGLAVKARAAKRGAVDAADLADYAGRQLQVVNAMNGKTLDFKADAEAAAKKYKSLLDELGSARRRHGNIADAVDEIGAKYGMTAEQKRNVAEYLDLQTALLNAARQQGDANTAAYLANFAGDAFPIGGPGRNFDPQALYDLILPGAKVEDVEVPDTEAAAQAQPLTEAQAAAKAELEAAEADIAAATVGSERRAAERRARRARKRLAKAGAKAPAPVRPTRKVQKVTLPNGKSYILERDTSAPDVHTPAFAASVEEAMKGDEDAITADEYMAMSPAEREDYLNDHDLAEGGSMRILGSDGKELMGADAVVKIKRGFRRFTRTGGNWELAHEHGHFISAIARQTMTDDEIATMRRLFGDPRSGVDEAWNEENANNQLAEWLRGKYDFKASTRAERRAKMNWFRRMLDTIKSFFWLTDEEPPVAPVEKAQREQALDAAFNALVNGDFSTLDAFAGIEFAEDKATPTAPATETAATEEAPAAPETPSAPTASPTPAPAAPRAPAASTPAPAPSPTVSTAALDTAMANLASDPEAVVAAKPVRTGTKRTVFTPGYEMSIEADAMWAPLSDLVESTDDREVQMRDRSRMATDQQIHDKTRKGVFQPLALFPGTKSDDGAPIVGGGLRIISGHGRKRMLETLVREGRFAEYLDAVNAECRRQGMPTAPEGMVNPVLVLRVTGGLDKRSDLTRFAELSNRWGGLERSGAEHAESDARKITDALLRLYAPDASGNLLAASNRPFMAAFLKEVGATGLTNADGTPTPEAALRVQRAMMTAIFGNDEKVRSMVKNLLERTQGLSLATLQNALLRSAGKLLAMKRHHGSFDIVADVREAAYQYIAWRSAQEKQPKLTLAEYLNEQDFFSDTASPMQKALARLLEADRFGTVLDKYVELVANEAVDAQQTFGGIFQQRTPLQLLGLAERALLSEGDEPVTPDPASAEAAAPVQTAPAVQSETETETTDTPTSPAPTAPADPVQAAQDTLTPPPPETFTPVPVKRGTATLPGPGAEPVAVHQVSADGKPSTAVRNAPPGAYSLLRPPYDAKKPVRASEQDKAGRGLGNLSVAADTKWNRIFPHFQGNKTEMANRTTQAIKNTMTEAERAHYETVVDYFGGGGCWGLYHALTSFPNCKLLAINEWEPGRIAKIQALHERGAAVADEAVSVITGEVYERLRDLCKVGENGEESGSGTTIANKLEQIVAENVFTADQLAPVFAFLDCAHTMLANRTDETGATSFDAGFAAVIDNLREDGRKAKEAADAFKARGGTITYRQGDAADWQDAPRGSKVMAVCDPPYYRTAGYNGQLSVPLHNDPQNPGWSYDTTIGLLRSLVDKGDGIVYTDEAWWFKEDYPYAATEEDMNGLFGAGVLDQIAANRDFKEEQEALLDIINNLDHFDVAGRVVGRQEVLGIHHGHDERAEGSEVGAGPRSDVPGNQADRRGDADGAGGRHSVRRMAGRAEAEDGSPLRNREGRGRAGSRLLAREVILQSVADSIAEASPDSDPAAVDALVRHSVRQVREERMAEYADYVSTNAKRWLKTAEKRIAERMAAAGFTEKVWHGTYGGDFNVFKFSANSHDVPAAYFTYNRGTAQNYAALRAMEYDDEAGANTRQFYVNPGKVLDIDEGKPGAATNYGEFVALVQKAYADGYNAIRIKNAFDDQGFRFDGDETLENMVTPTADHDVRTDILIVMQQPGDIAPARIKAADPVTFMDEDYGGMPVPLDMRADIEMPDVRFSVSRGFAKAAPMTAAEIRRAVRLFGTTTDPKDTFYITPDGEWLDYSEGYEHFDIWQAFDTRRIARLQALQEDEGDATPQIASALKGGLVRVTGGIFFLDGQPKELGMQFTGRPDAKTLDNMERFFDAVAERYPSVSLSVENVSEDDAKEWTRMYTPDETARIMRDLREYARTGEPPPEPSLVSQFHSRHSVLSSGRYYGTGLREIAHGLKRGDQASIEQAADLMAQNVPPNAVLVPMPGHEGPATTMLPLAEAIAARVKGATVVDALVAEPHESNYTHKQRVHRPVKVTMHSTGAKIPKGRPVLVVDNVIASGATYRAAQAVIPNADLLTLADAGRGRETRGQRERMRHSVFMGVRGAVYDKPILNRLYDATAMARKVAPGNTLSGNTGKNRKWYTPKVRDEIYAKTGWWLGTDGQWRVEIPDMKPKALAELQDGDFKGELAHPVPITDLVSNARLFKAYSELKNVTVWFVDPDSDEMAGLAGMLDGDNILMTWDDLTSLDPEEGEIKLTYEGMQTLTHEVQHFVQFVEGFATGGSQSVNGKRNYALLAGEVEARNAERRYGGPYGTYVSARQDEAMRREMMNHSIAPWQTEDVPTIEQLISHGDGRQTDVNGNPVARQSVTRGRGTRLSDLATAFVASRQLAGKEVSVEDTDKLLKNLGFQAMNANDLVTRAKELADRNREAARKLVERNSPELVAHLASANMADQLTDALNAAIAGGAKAADPDTGAKIAQAVQSKQTRDLMAAHGFDAAQMMAELPISLANAVFAVAEYEKSPEEMARLEEARKKREEERAAEEAEAADEGITVEELRERKAREEAESVTYREPTDEERAKLDELLNRARFADEARKAEEDRLAAIRKRKAEEAAAREQNAEEGEENPDEGGSGDADDLPPLPAETVRRIAPVFESAELFAQFIIEWTADKVVEKHPEIPSTAEMWKNPVAVRELKQTATHILRQLAKDVLGSPSLNYSRNFADHAINELESDAEIKTFNAVRRKIARIYDQIHDNALRISRRKQVNELIKQIKKTAGAKGRFSAITEEMQRTIDGKTELWARRLIPYLTMSEEKLQAEIARLTAIVRHDPTATDTTPPTPDAVQEAADRLALANKYGGMSRWMPGQIADAAEEIMAQLNGARQAFEQKRELAKQRNQTIRDALVNAMQNGASEAFRGKRGIVGAYFDAMQGNLTLQMQNLIRFCKDPALRQAALEAIDELQIAVSEASGRYRTVMGQAQAELRQGMESIYGSAEAGMKHLLSDEIPDDAARAIFNQSRDAKPTYGQLLQLYATTIQSDYKGNAEKHGRDQQLPLMEATLTEQDRRFHAWAVEWYRQNRAALSEAVEAVTGLPVTSPDAMYTHAKMRDEPDGFTVEALAWSPVPSALNRRVRHNRDFDEKANFLAVLQEQCEVRAQTIGYAEAGIFLRDTIAHRDVQTAARKHVGAADIKAVTDHVRDVLVQAAARKDQSAFFAPLNAARAWMARFYLSGNIPSAVKQLASMPVWACAMLGGKEVGVKSVMRYLTSVGTDEGKQAIRELMASDGYKARYVMGWSEETQNVLANPSKRVVLKQIAKVMDKGMVVNKFVDGVSCLWMAQGFYRDATRHFLDKGLDETEAKRKAMALTWSVLESGQQSGRIENQNLVQRRGGAAAAAIFQFKTASLLQTNYVLQAAKECLAGTPGAKGRLLRAMVINNIYIPAFISMVTAAWKAIMGDEPPDEDPEKMPRWFKDFVWSCANGAAAPMFGVNVAAKGLYDGLVGNSMWAGQESVIPAITGAGRIFHNIGKTAKDAISYTVFDVEQEVTGEKLRKDIDRLLRDLAAPYRHGSQFYKNRFGEE